MRHSVASLVVTALVLTACTVNPAPTPGTSASSTPSSPAHPSLPPGLGEYPSGETEGPFTYSPDSMWSRLSTTPDLIPGALPFADAVELTDVIVVGRMLGVERGGGYGAPGEGVGWHAVALVDPDEVIRGTPVVESDGLIRVEFMFAISYDGFPAKQFADLERSIPRDPAVLFLYSWASYYGQSGFDVPDWIAPTNVEDRYRTIGYDGHLRVVDGRVQPPAGDDTPRWPDAYAGMPLEEFADLIRDAAS